MKKNILKDMFKRTISIIGVLGILLCLINISGLEYIFAEPEEDNNIESDDNNEYSGEYLDSADSGEGAEETDEQGGASDQGTEGNDAAEPGDSASTNKPEIVAQSAAVYCRNTGELVYAKNADKRLAPYSITKILTCLLAIQKLPMDQTVTVSAMAAAEDGTSMNLKEGEEVTVEQLLHGTMILSGNDAAYALAEAVTGDAASFVDLMNETAINLGCKNTHFVNPNGNTGDVEQQYTTAKDFVEICKLAFNNQTFMQIAGKTEYDMPETNLSDAYTMKGHNELLMEGREGYVAGKTGYWYNGEATIAMDYFEGSLELITVVLGGDTDTRGEDCDQLIDYAVSNIEGLRVVEKGDVVANVRIRHGEITRIEAVTADESYVYLPKAASKELIQLVAELNQNTDAPIKSGDQVGVYKVYLADELLDEVPLVSPIDVGEGWIFSYIGIANRTALIIGGLLTALLLLIIVRSINKSRMRKKKREEIRQRLNARDTEDA